MKLPKTLVISRSIPPRISGSAIITENLAKQFSPDEMVVVGLYSPGLPAVQWEPRWPRLIYAAVGLPRGWRGERWIQWTRLPLIVLVSLFVLVTQRCQVILAVYPDEVFLFAAYITHILSGKKLYAYFHNTLVEARPHSSFARWLQKRVFRAEHVFVMSEGMEKLYGELYPTLSCSPLVHSFAEPLPIIENIELGDLSRTGAPLKFALSGNFNHSNSGAVGLIAAVLRNLDNIIVHIYGGTAPAHLKKFGFDGAQFKKMSPVSRNELLQGLAQADILLLPHGFSDTLTEEEAKTIFPTRTIEYLISGRPILALIPQDCFLFDFLQQHQCAFIVTELNEEALLQAIDRLMTDPDLCTNLVRNALSTAKMFQASVVAEHLRQTIIDQP